MRVGRLLVALGVLTDEDAVPPVPVIVGALVLPLGLAAATYFNFMVDGFALDDFIILDRVSNVGLIEHLRQSFSSPHSYATPYDSLTFWRPLGMLHYFSLRSLFGLDPLPFHLANLLLHGLNAALLMCLIAMLARSRLVGLVAGAVFAVLPTFDIAVTWISQAFELLAASFILTCMLLFTAYLRTGRSSLLLYAGSLLAALLASLSKESAVCLLPVLVSLVIAVEGPSRAWRERVKNIRDMVPFAVLTLFFALFVFVYDYEYSEGPASYRLGSHMLGNLWDSLRWLTLPLSRGWGSWVAAASQITASLLLIGGALAAVMRRGLVAFLVVWVLIALLPFMPFRAGVELRYTYLASLPLAALIAVLVGSFFSRLSSLSPVAAPPLAAIVLFSLVLFLSVLARDHQGWLHYQSVEFETLIRDIASECHSLRPGTWVFALNSPLFDPYNDRTQAAVALAYPGVNAQLAEDSLPPVAGAIAEKCVLVYSDGRYFALPY
jgi:hypothetical protein